MDRIVKVEFFHVTKNLHWLEAEKEALELIRAGKLEPSRIETYRREEQ